MSTSSKITYEEAREAIEKLQNFMILVKAEVGTITSSIRGNFRKALKIHTSSPSYSISITEYSRIDSEPVYTHFYNLEKAIDYYNKINI